MLKYQEVKVYRILIAISLFVCGIQAATADTRTKSWFLTHPEDRAVQIAMCRNDPGTARNVANCINAEEAADSNAIREFNRHVSTHAYLCSQMPPAFKAVNNCGAR